MAKRKRYLWLTTTGEDPVNIELEVFNFLCSTDDEKSQGKANKGELFIGQHNKRLWRNRILLKSQPADYSSIALLIYTDSNLYY